MIARFPVDAGGLSHPVARVALAWVPEPEPAPEPVQIQAVDVTAFLADNWGEIQLQAKYATPQSMRVEDFASELAVYVAERAECFDPARGSARCWIKYQARAVRTLALRRSRIQRKHEVQLHAEDDSWIENLAGPYDGEARIALAEVIETASPRERVWIRGQLLGATAEEQAAEAGVGARAVRTAGKALRDRHQEEGQWAARP